MTNVENVSRKRKFNDRRYGGGENGTYYITKVYEKKWLDQESGIAILTFDLENVLKCPQSEIRPIFYHSKLNIYNLTAHIHNKKDIFRPNWVDRVGTTLLQH